MSIDVPHPALSYPLPVKTTIFRHVQQTFALPVELICLVFAFLSGHKKTLHICTTLCKALQRNAQNVLFRNLVADKKTHHQLCIHFILYPELKPFVKAITFNWSPNTYRGRALASPDRYDEIINLLPNLEWITLYGHNGDFSCTDTAAVVDAIRKHAVREEFRGITVSASGVDMIPFYTLPKLNQLHIKSPVEPESLTSQRMDKTPSAIRFLSLSHTMSGRCPLSPKWLNLSELVYLRIAVQPLRYRYRIKPLPDWISDFLPLASCTLRELHYAPPREVIEEPKGPELDLSTVPNLSYLSLHFSKNRNTKDLIDAALWTKRLISTSPNTLRLDTLRLILAQTGNSMSWREDPWYRESLSAFDSILEDVESSVISNIQFKFVMAPMHSSRRKKHPNHRIWVEDDFPELSYVSTVDVSFTRRGKWVHTAFLKPSIVNAEV